MTFDHHLNHLNALLCPVAAAIAAAHTVNTDIALALALYFTIISIQAAIEKTAEHFQVGNQKQIKKGDQFLDLPLHQRPGL